MPRVEPIPASPDGNAVSNSLLARVLGRRPDVLKAFARLDTTLRFKGLLPLEIKEAVRDATAGKVGCDYCASLSVPRPANADPRLSLAVAFAELVAQDPNDVPAGMFDVLREEFSEEEIVELVAWTCLVAIAGQMFGAVMGLEATTPEEAAEYQATQTALVAAAQPAAG
jgi:alkylhydroperoxidase family enzyme